MENIPPPLESSRPVVSPNRSGWKKKALIAACVIFGVAGISAASAAWWYQYNFNAAAFKPVQLSLAEKQAVEEKLATLDGQTPASDPAKTIVLNEREINGYLEQQGFGETVKFRIREGGIGAVVLAPVDAEVPVLGGHTLRFKVDFNTRLDDNKRFAFSLADVSVGGISLPNAWLGNVKGLNLLDESAHGDMPLLRAFAAGVKSLHLKNGELRLVLND